MQTITGVGQDSHIFDFESPNKPLKLGGLTIPNAIGLKGNSDADVILHAICNAISSISTVVVLGPITDKLCKQGITNSDIYVKKALSYLQENTSIQHIAISVECRHPKLLKHINNMRSSIAKICNILDSQVGITATTGEGLTAFGQGAAIQAFVILTARINNN